MSTQQIFRGTLVVLVTLAVAYVLIISRHTLLLVLVAVLIASAVRPIVMRLTQWRIPVSGAILIVYGLILLITLILTIIVLPPVINQFANYLENNWRLASRIISVQTEFERIISDITQQEDFELVEPNQIREGIADLVIQVRTSIPSVLDNLSVTLGDAVLVFVMGVYWLTSRDKAVNFLTELLTYRHREQARVVISEIEETMGSYIRGIVFVAGFVGTTTFIILFLFRVPDAATLAFIIGVTTLLPVVGGLIGGGLATLLALLTSPVNGLIVFVTFFIIQQFEAHYLSPRIMAQSVRLDPLLVIVAMLIGFATYGIMGAIVSIPAIGALHILLRTLVFEPRKAQLQPKIEQGGVLLQVGDEPQKVAVAPHETIK